MKYLLDTCVISDFVKGEANTLRNIKTVLPSDIAVSTITVMEIEFGLALNPKQTIKIKPVILDFLSQITILNYTQEDAVQTALVRTLLKKQGSPIGAYDVMLAGTAINNKLIFVSANEKEFVKVLGLKLENWRFK